MKKLVGILFALALAAIGVWTLARSGRDGGPEYRFVPIERGDVEWVVSATGALEPVTTVEVGTQVSGIISSILVDFNDRVERGQIVARIDPTLLEIAVRRAEADLDRARATLRDAERESGRAERLHGEGVVSDVDLDAARFALESAHASWKSAEVGLEQARRNLEYATIYAPISGTVVERDVDVGQTVAASLSAPKLFLIAGDLSRMQILAAVDEADIAHIHDGQAVRFTVQAHGERTFEGSVRQVRLQSTSAENVVSYSVVVDVPNPDGLLRPGMTATVEFLVDAARDVLRVPNAALRFRPTEDMVAAVREAGAGRPAAGRGGGPDASDRSGRRGPGVRPRDGGRLWYVGPDGKLAVARVETGITDGQYTVIRGDDLADGLPVIAGVTRTEDGPASPFGGSGAPARRGPPGAL